MKLFDRKVFLFFTENVRLPQIFNRMCSNAVFNTTDVKPRFRILVGAILTYIPRSLAPRKPSLVTLRSSARILVKLKQSVLLLEKTSALEKNEDL